MSYSVFHHAAVTGITYVLPDNIKRNIDECIDLFDGNSKKLERAKKMMGYGDIYIAPEGLTTVDICTYAAEKLIQSLNIEIDSIDTLIFVSENPDYFAPASAQVIHNNLKLSKNCAVFDVGQGCTGYIYGLWLASSLVESKASKRMLLCAGDVVIRDDDVENKTNSLLFSDSGSATLIEYSDNEVFSSYLFGSDGSKYESIIYPAGRGRLPITKDILDTVLTDKDGNQWKLHHSFMDGLSVFDFTINIVPKHIEEFLTKINKSEKDIDFFAFHQANKQIVKTIISKMNLQNEQFLYDTFSRYGNTGSISCLCNLLDKYGCNIPNEKRQVVLTSFGIGLSWCSVLMNTSTIKHAEIVFHTFENIKSHKDILLYWKEKLENYGTSM